MQRREKVAMRLTIIKGVGGTADLSTPRKPKARGKAAAQPSASPLGIPRPLEAVADLEYAPAKGDTANQAVTNGRAVKSMANTSKFSP